MTWGSSSTVKVPSISAAERRAKMHEQIKRRMQLETNHLICAVLGHPGTGKSGSCMDCRTDEEKEQGMKVLVLDLDDGCTSTWISSFDKDPNIEIIVPIERFPNGRTDWNETFKNCQEWVAEARERIDSDENIKAVVVDGMDKMSQGSNDVLRYSMLSDHQKRDRDSLIKATANMTVPPLAWGVRNDVHAELFLNICGLETHKLFITHVKPVYDGANLSKDFAGFEPDWHKWVPQRMLQIIHIRKERDGRDTYYEATLEKCKTNPLALNKKWEVFRITEDENGQKGFNWNGIEDLKLGKFTSESHDNTNTDSSKDPK